MTENNTSLLILKLKGLNHIGQPNSKEIDLKSIFNHFGPLGHHLLVLFMILPFLQPIPLFGLSTPFGLMIGLLSAFSYYNKPPWLPEIWSKRTLSKETINKVIFGLEKIFNKISKIIKNRWPIFFNKPFHEISVFLNIVNAILLALPLPIPFSNALPAWTIFFYAIAQIEKDGLFILISYAQTLFCFIYFALLLKGASLSFDYLNQIPFLKNIFSH